MSDSVITIQYWKSPLGELLLGATDAGLCLCDWRYRRMRDQVDQRVQNFLSAEYVEGHHDLIDQAIAELDAYLAGKLQAFTIKLQMAGSEFQQAVWHALLDIPFGETVSYLGLAQNMGRESAIRAVAAANGANALSIFIPCHRVIGSDGSLTGYAGGLPAKKKLLSLEGAIEQAQLNLL